MAQRDGVESQILLRPAVAVPKIRGNVPDTDVDAKPKLFGPPLHNLSLRIVLLSIPNAHLCKHGQYSKADDQASCCK